jgi:hypothetical protein
MGLARSDPGNIEPVKRELRGEAAWRAHRDAIASRNDRATRLARARRQEKYEQAAARQRAADLRERAALAKRNP